MCRMTLRYADYANSLLLNMFLADIEANQKNLPTLSHDSGSHQTNSCLSATFHLTSLQQRKSVLNQQEFPGTNLAKPASRQKDRITFWIRFQTCWKFRIFLTYPDHQRGSARHNSAIYRTIVPIIIKRVLFDVSAYLVYLPALV